MFRQYCIGFVFIFCVAALNAGAAETETPYSAPKLFDHKVRDDLPDIGEIKQIRFLTESDYPPFQFLRSDGELTGFNIDLARLICKELKLACTIQPWRWDKLNDALASGAGDAIIASQKPTVETRAVQSYSAPYYLTPARFVVLKSASTTISPAALKGKTLAVVSGSAHEAYLKAVFPALSTKPYANLEAAESALLAKDVDGLFGDGVSLAIWLAQDKGDCCMFAGGPYLESYFFGEGARIAFRRDDQLLRIAVNVALRRLDARGALNELYWKYFPVGFY